MAKSKKIKSVMVIGNPKKKWIADLVGQVCEWLPKLVRVDMVDITMSAPIPKKRPDMILVFGGDGTILSTARRLGGAQCPVLGVNTGRLGFLTALGPNDDLRPCLEKIFEGDYKINKRMMISADIPEHLADKDVRKKELALNDIAIARYPSSRSLLTKVTVDGEYAVTYEGDGVIISTSTGSTAYSLSVGGPLLMPDIEAFILSPICPFTLSQRPLVISGGSRIAIQVESDSDIGLAVDGQVHYALKNHDTIEIKKAPKKFGMVELPGQSHFETLRNKLHWGVRPRHHSRPHLFGKKARKGAGKNE